MTDYCYKFALSVLKQQNIFTRNTQTHLQEYSLGRERRRVLGHEAVGGVVDLLLWEVVHRPHLHAVNYVSVHVLLSIYIITLPSDHDLRKVCQTCHCKIGKMLQ